MAVRAEKHAPKEATLATTLTRIDPGDDVAFVWVSCDSELHLVFSNALDDGGAVPASDRFRIPANVAWPVEVYPGLRILVAALSGTPVATFLGVP